MAFDAGSIEARLTLDRAEFNRELEAAKQAGKDFDGKDFTAEVKADADQAKEEFASTDAAYEALRENLSRTINVEVDADTAAADAELEATTVLADHLDGKKVDIDVGSGGIGGLITRIGALGDSFGRMGQNISEGTTVWSGLVSTIIAAAPLIIAALAPLLAITGALAVGLIGAIASIGGVAAVAVPMLSKVLKAQQDLNKARQAEKNATTDAQRNAALQKQADILSTLTGTQKVMLHQLTEIQNQWGQIQKMFATPLANALKPWFAIVRELLGQLPNLIRPGLEAFKTIGQVILPIVRSPEFKSFIKELGTFGAFAFKQFAIAGLALAHAFILIFRAFEPLARSVLPGLVNLVREFATWASGLSQSAGFRAFIKYAIANAPVLGNLLLNLLIVFVKLGVALAPLGALMLKLLGVIVKFLASLSPNQLLLIVIAVGALGIALAAAFAGVPVLIGLVVAAIIALAALIVNWWGSIKHAWNNGINFIKRAWDLGWEFIKDVIDTAKERILIVFDNLILGALRAVSKIVDVFAKLPGPLGAPFRKAKGFIDDTMAKMQDQIRQHLNNIQTDFNRLHGKKVTVLVAGSGTWKALSSAGQFAGGGFQAQSTKHPGGQHGLLVPGRDSGKDDQLVMARGGELMVPPELVRSGVVDHLRGLIPGFAAGGIVPNYRGDAPGLSPWTLRNVNATSADIVRKTAQSMAEVWKQAMQSMTSIGSGITGGPPVGPIQAYARRLLTAYGWGNQWGAFNTLEMHEAGWNPNAQNPTSTAYGLGQFLDTTWATVGASKTSNPYLQLNAMMAYIRQRYGSPAAAWAQYYAHPGGVGWYDKGGALGPGDHLVSNRTGQTEEVLTPAERRAFVALARGGGGGNTDLLVRLDRLIKAVERNAVTTAAGVAEALNGTARGAAYRAAYSTRGV
jgi:hypothetical protein